MFNKKMSKDNKAFRDALVKVAEDPEVKHDPKFEKLLNDAIKKAEKNQSIQSIGSNLAFQIRANVPEKELPKSMIYLQLAIERYNNFGGDSMIPFLNKFYGVQD